MNALDPTRQETMTEPTAESDALVRVLMNLDVNPYGDMFRDGAEKAAARVLASDWLAGVIAEAKDEAWDAAISIICDCGDFDGHPGDCAATPLIHAATRVTPPAESEAGR